MTEKEYRALPSEEYFSYSFLKSFDEFGPTNLIKPRKIENSGITFGSIVDVLSFSEEDFDKLYYISKTEKDLTETEKKLYNFYSDNSSNNNELFTTEYVNSEDFIKYCLNIISELKLWNNIKKEETLKTKITNNLREHILEIPISRNKKIISTQDYMDAQYTVKVLKEHDFTKQYFDNKNIEKKQVLFQIPILFKIREDKFKSLLDIILIDMKNKTIRALDLKTGAKPNRYFLSEFFKRRYDIQSFLYTKALEEYIVLNDLKDFSVLDPIYIYTCRFTPDSPLPFEISSEILKSAYTGYYTPANRQIYGVHQLVEAIKWHRKTGIYNYTQQEYENKISRIDGNNTYMGSRIISIPNDLFNNYSQPRNTIGIDIENRTYSFTSEQSRRSDEYNRAMRNLQERIAGSVPNW